jgi:hypothetical protein
MSGIFQPPPLGWTGLFFGRVDRVGWGSRIAFPAVSPNEAESNSSDSCACFRDAPAWSTRTGAWHFGHRTVFPASSSFTRSL